MSRHLEREFPTSLDEQADEASIRRRTALKRGLALVPLIVTVPSRPAWAGYASLDPNYGAESQSG